MGRSTSAGFNAAITKVVNPSTHKGGTLTFGDSSTPDSTDPGNTYYAFIVEPGPVLHDAADDL